MTGEWDKRAIRLGVQAAGEQLAQAAGLVIAAASIKLGRAHQAERRGRHVAGELELGSA